jgi:hypothetical protein
MPASPRVTPWLVWNTRTSVVRTVFRHNSQRLSIHRASKDCGTAFANGGGPAAAADCSMVCSGNSSEWCGGPARLNVYNYTGTNLPSTGTTSVTLGGVSVQPVLSNLTTGWSYNACWV